MSSYRTRFAPTCSGNLHLGSLANCLLNFLVARKNGSEFFLRIDRHPDQTKYEQSIIDDLKALGFEPDKIILQRERDARYVVVMDQILKQHLSLGQVYFCDCSVQDITFRAASGKSKPIYMHREEKYPSSCNIARVRIFGPDGDENDLSKKSSVRASLSSRFNLVENILDDDLQTYWAPKDVGYLGSVAPEIIFEWKTPIWVSKLEVTFKGSPLREYEVSVPDYGSVTVSKSNAYYFASHEPDAITEIVALPPGLTKRLNFTPKRYMHQVKKEYYYDGYCRERKLSLPLYDRSTTLRTCCDWVIPDVAIFFDGQADLALTSMIDDLDYDIGIRVRGTDIEPFTRLEEEARKLITKKKIPNYFHPMLCDNTTTKFSKFIGSQRAVELLQNHSADKILTYLAKKLGILPYRDDVLSLNELVDATDFDHMEDVRDPIICRPERELTIA